MANTTSAKKELRKNPKRRAANAYRFARTEALLRTHNRRETSTIEEVAAVQQALDKTAKAGLMHPRKVSRLISRLMRKTSGRRAA